MNCDEYLERWLSAHADDQLSGVEWHLAEEHVRACHQCHVRMTEEHAVKASIRRYAGIVKAPADVRLRIRAALGELAEHAPHPKTIFAGFRESSARQPFTMLRRAAKPGVHRYQAAYPPGAMRLWLALQLKRAQYIAPVAVVVILLAAATVVSRITFRSMSGQTVPDYQRSIPAFDFAVDRFNQLSQEFSPNVPPEAFSQDGGAYFAWVMENDPVHHVSAELPDISASYEKMQMLPEFCDFALAGYELVGGRLDRMANGELVTYTLYRNQTKSILSIGLKLRISAPQGGYWFDTHALYSYRGYSICLTIYPADRFASIIVTRAPMIELLRSVAASDIAVWNQ
jgi:hypothetical protein